MKHLLTAVPTIGAAKLRQKVNLETLVFTNLLQTSQTCLCSDLNSLVTSMVVGHPDIYISIYHLYIHLHLPSILSSLHLSSA